MRTVGLTFTDTAKAPAAEKAPRPKKEAKAPAAEKADDKSSE